MSWMRATGLIQIEILVQDLQRSIEFYEGAFGWCPVPAQMQDRCFLQVPLDARFGISLVQSSLRSSLETSTILYFQVDSAESILKSVGLHHGTVIQQPQTYSKVGRVALVADPDGQRYGLVTTVPD